MGITLKGITWDHERGYDPLVAVSEVFQKRTGHVVTWRKRSLRDFGDFPLEKLIPDYDLVMLDHPFTGEALQRRLLLPLNQLLAPQHFQQQSSESLGPCWASYLQVAPKTEQQMQEEPQIMALPVDAACLVSAAQEGMLGDNTAPTSWSELRYICAHLGRERVALPLCAVDIWCVFLTLGAQCGGDGFFTGSGFQVEHSAEAIELLRELSALVHPLSFQLNPIQLFDQMGATGAIRYTPFAFGYSNYSRQGYRKQLLTFYPSPTLGRNGYSTLLGGVGIGISAQTQHAQIAADYIRLLTTPEIQSGLYTQAGGQPAHRSAWQSAQNNALCANFFANTQQSIEAAYVRPRLAKFNLFQEQVSLHLHTAMQQRVVPKKIVQMINQLFAQIVCPSGEE